MLRLDLHFLVCCCGAFLPHKKKANTENDNVDDVQNEDYYKLLGVNRFARSEDIRKAYKKLSLEFHPGKKKLPTCPLSLIQLLGLSVLFN